MVGHLKGPRQIDQGARSLSVNIGCRIQDSEHDTLGAQLFRHEHVASHYLELIGAVTKIACPRTDHDVQTDCDSLAGGSDQAGAGSDSAFHQAAAQLHSVRSPALGRDGGVQGIDANLDGKVIDGHGFGPQRLR
jgi:hypothetical protein